MSLAAGVTAFESLEEPIQCERYFRDKADVHNGCCKRCIRCDKAGVATHELHEAKAVECTVCFDVCACNHVRGTEHGGFKTERPVDQVQVVIDRLRDADNRDGLLTLLDFFSNSMCTTKRTVTTDAEQHVDVESHERIDHDGRVLHAAGATENRTAVFLNGIDHIRVKHDGGVTVIRVQATVAVRDTEDVPHAVVEPEHLYKALDHVVEAWAETAASDDTCARPGGVVENCLSRAGHFE